MKTKKTVTPFNMQEIARALREMISEDSPNASEALLSGTREAVFREIFIFHYPSFLEKLYQSIPEVDKDEELICMLVALGQSVKEIAEFCRKEKKTLWDEPKRLFNPHKVYVDLSQKLYDTKTKLLNEAHH